MNFCILRMSLFSFGPTSGLRLCRAVVLFDEASIDDNAMMNGKTCSKTTL
jgi:hypothetical protein